MSKKLPFFCIAELCIGFSLLLYALCYPSLGSHYEDNRKQLIIESALGDTSGIAWKWATETEKQVLLKNYDFSQKLPETKKNALAQLKTSLMQHIEDRSLVSYTLTYLLQNPYFFLYIVASIIVPITLLLKVDCAHALSIFLPLIAVCFAFDNALFASPKKMTQEEALFPKENELVIGATLQERLDRFLVQKHLKITPEHLLKSEIEEAAYLFLVDRAIALKIDSHHQFEIKKEINLLFIFICWNMIFPLLSFKIISLEAV